MGKVSDARGAPGDIVLVRGGTPTDVWRDVPRAPNGASISVARAGRVQPNSVGLIIGNYVSGWTYVLFSNPLLLGWIQDGYLRPVKVKP